MVARAILFAGAVQVAQARMCFESTPYDGCGCDHVYCCRKSQYVHFESNDYICFFTHGTDAGPKPPKVSSGTGGYVADCSAHSGPGATCYCMPKAGKHKEFSDEFCWAYNYGATNVANVTGLEVHFEADPPRLESEAEPCPWTSGKCRNSEGQCASCDKSPWYDSDKKCTCGPAAADWMTADQCTACTLESEVVAEPCPWTSGKCRNSEGQCASCDKSPWYDSDKKCTCGPAAADWMTADQCTACTLESEVVAEPCPWTSGKCRNSEGQCASCDKSPWYDSDKKCTCGPAAADWITADQCTACSLESEVAV